MPLLPAAQREEKKWDIYEMSLDGRNVTSIAKQVGLHRQVVKELLDEAICQINPWREEKMGQLRDYLLEKVTAIEDEANQHIEATRKGEDNTGIAQLLSIRLKAVDEQATLLGLKVKRVQMQGETKSTLSLKFDRAPSPHIEVREVPRLEAIDAEFIGEDD